jgi:hypothetical protein
MPSDKFVDCLNFLVVSYLYDEFFIQLMTKGSIIVEGKSGGQYIPVTAGIDEEGNTNVQIMMDSRYSGMPMLFSLKPVNPQGKKVLPQKNPRSPDERERERGSIAGATVRYQAIQGARAYVIEQVFVSTPETAHNKEILSEIQKALIDSIREYLNVSQPDTREARRRKVDRTNLLLIGNLAEPFIESGLKEGYGRGPGGYLQVK